MISIFTLVSSNIVETAEAEGAIALSSLSVIFETHLKSAPTIVGKRYGTHLLSEAYRILIEALSHTVS
jgi:hypothetical protein